MGQTQTVFLPPWIPSTEEEKEREPEFRKAILDLANTTNVFMVPHPVAEDEEFDFDWQEHRPFAEAAYRADPRLSKLLPRLVPKRIPEEDFWRNYFSHVYAIKQQFAGDGAIEIPAIRPGDTAGAEVHVNGLAEPEPGQVNGLAEVPDSPAPAAEITIPDPISAQKLASMISYPQKFHLATKYVHDGPTLPNFNDSDKLLMESLFNQATIGPCNRPRPSMWESAESKARWESWKKLDKMNEMEAMRLYVQALELFCPDWLLWPGLDLQLPADLLHPQQSKQHNHSITAAASPDDTQATPGINGGPGADKQRKAPEKERADLTLFTLGISPGGRALLLLLRQLSTPVNIDVQMVDPSHGIQLPSDLYNPVGKLPLLQDQGGGSHNIIWDSQTIMGYLISVHCSQNAADQQWYPAEPSARASVDQMLAYRHAMLWPAVERFVYPQVFPFSPHTVGNDEAVREQRAAAEARLEVELHRLNTSFLGGRRFHYLCGDTATLADLSCAMALSVLEWLPGYSFLDGHPHVNTWYQAICALPGYEEISTQHTQFCQLPQAERSKCAIEWV